MDSAAISLDGVKYLRPADLARRHGLSTQAVRNYEAEGFLPAAARTPSGYRMFTEVHGAALSAFLALVTGYGHATAGRIMNALNAGDLDRALRLIDEGHVRLVEDRRTLDSVRHAVEHLTDTGAEPPRPEPGAAARTIGELAHLLRVTPATLRNWEEAGILSPDRERGTGFRRYGPSDVRDARLAHLLRRGGYPLERIALVVAQVRTAGGTDELADALAQWHGRLLAQGTAMLDAAAKVGEYLRLRSDSGTDTATVGSG